VASWNYIQVPGFLVNRGVRGKDSEAVVSEVEIIEDKAIRNGVTESLLKQYPGARVEIW
jgi:hypothetical protein